MLSGANDFPFKSFEDAMRVCEEMPQLLKDHTKTLSAKLLTISYLDSTVKHTIREMDQDGSNSEVSSKAEQVSDELSFFAKKKTIN